MFSGHVQGLKKRMGMGMGANGMESMERLVRGGEDVIHICILYSCQIDVYTCIQENLLTIPYQPPSTSRTTIRCKTNIQNLHTSTTYLRRGLSGRSSLWLP